MRTPRAVLCLSLAMATLVAPMAAHAQQAAPGKEVAKRLFEEGADLEKRGEYFAALAKYKEAEQITVTPGLRFHKAYCLEMTARLTAAVEEYEAADKLARETNKPEVRAAVAARLEPVRARIPQIAIRVATQARNVEVQLDGNPVAAGMLDGKSFHVDPGEHAVTARAPGFKNFVHRVQVPESVTTAVDVTLERAPAAAATPPGVTPPPVTTPGGPSAAPTPAVIEPPSEAPAHRSLAAPIATAVGTVLLAGAGVAFFVVAGSTQSDANSACLLKKVCADEQTRVRTFDALALGSFIGAAGLGVVSAVLWSSKGGERTASVVTRPVAGGGSLGFEGSF